jgi:hypothetical protein
MAGLVPAIHRPFAPSEPKDNIASSKPNDFKDFGEQ